MLPRPAMMPQFNISADYSHAFDKDLSYDFSGSPLMVVNGGRNWFRASSYIASTLNREQITSRIVILVALILYQHITYLLGKRTRWFQLAAIRRQLFVRRGINIFIFGGKKKILCELSIFKRCFSGWRRSEEAFFKFCLPYSRWELKKFINPSWSISWPLDWHLFLIEVV